jgi:hypothetical protein
VARALLFIWQDQESVIPEENLFTHAKKQVPIDALMIEETRGCYGCTGSLLSKTYLCPLI